jgi:hypothetical protein
MCAALLQGVELRETERGGTRIWGARACYLPAQALKVEVDREGSEGHRYMMQVECECGRLALPPRVGGEE